ncbi:hypothetical protein CHUAL_008336 [Chamberlinius hualienensis]
MATKNSFNWLFTTICWTIIYGVHLKSTSVTSQVLNNDTPACYYFDTEQNSIFDNWYWSYTIEPSNPVPAYSGSYVWANKEGARVTLTTVYEVDSNTVVQFDYFCSSENISFALYFVPIDDLAVEVAYIENDTFVGLWNSSELLCSNCCGDGISCRGQFVFEIIRNDQADCEVAAIDNFQLDGECYDSNLCCDFDDYIFCGYTSYVYDSYYWQQSRTSTPINEPDSPGSNYAYFEVIDYNEPDFLYIVLDPVITRPFDNSNIIRGQFYVSADTRFEKNAIELVFYDDHKQGQVLTKIKDTAGEWKKFEIDCSVVNCCNGNQICNGYVQIFAYVEGNSGTAFYAVDELTISDKCTDL